MGEYNCRDRRSHNIVSDTLWRLQGVYDYLLANLARRPAGISSGRSDIAPNDKAFPVYLLCPLIDTRFLYEVKPGRQLQIPSNGAWSRNIVWRTRWLNSLRIAHPSEDTLLWICTPRYPLILEALRLNNLQTIRSWIQTNTHKDSFR